MNIFVFQTTDELMVDDGRGLLGINGDYIYIIYIYICISRTLGISIDQPV